MKWMSADAEHRDLAAEWDRLRRSRNRWGFAFFRSHQRQERRRPPLASAAEMKRAKWKMNYERDENGRLI